MGGKGGKKVGTHRSPGLRDESWGKNQRHVNAKTMQKLNHLKNLAMWAAESSIPPVTAFFGERLAAITKGLGIRSDPSLFSCERCETILQPGNNCTVRVETSKPKKHRAKKSNLVMQNVVVSRCHFCSHRNIMRGTPKGYLKEILPSKLKPISGNLETVVDEVEGVETIAEVEGLENHIGPATSSPSPGSGLSLLDSNRRKRNRSGAKKIDKRVTTSSAADKSSKKRKRSWVGLKEISLKNEINALKNDLN